MEVLKSNPFVQNVTIIGVADRLVDEVRTELSQSDEAIFLDKITFIKESELRETDAPSSFSRPTPIYLSIDKDALAPAFAATNWDQGSLSTETLKTIVTKLAASHKIIGIDICGERSHDFEGNEQHTVQQADALNNALNRELVEFLREL